MSKPAAKSTKKTGEGKAASRKTHESPVPSRRVWLIGCGVLALLALLALFGGGGSEKKTIYTDGQENQPKELARLREVVWTTPIPVFPSMDDSVDRYDPAVTDGGLTLVFVAGLPKEGADLFIAKRELPTDEWGEPQPIAALNSTSDELGPAFSSDGRFLFFSSDRKGGLGNQDIWVARREGDGWSRPINLGEEVNTKYDEIDPVIRRSMDLPGNTDGRLHPAGLYFASNRVADEQPDTKLPRWRGTARAEYPVQLEDFDLFLARIKAGKLSKPTPTELEADADEEPGKDVTADSATNLLAQVMAVSPQQPGAFEKPQRLGHLNTSARDAMPSVTRLGDYIYFSSRREGGEGGFDIHRARWHPEPHRVPSNVGSPLNTAANETDPVLYSHGHEMIFSSDRGAGEIPTFQLFHSRTTEVIPFVQVNATTPRATGGFWHYLQDYKWWILLLLLALLALLALLKNLLNEENRRTLSVLQRCLLGSLALHILLAFLLSLLVLSHAVYKKIRKEQAVELELNEGNMAVQRMSQQIREAVPELPKAQANLPAEQPTQPASASVQQLSAAPTHPVEVEQQAKPNNFAVEPAQVQTTPVPQETLAEMTRPPILPDQSQLETKLVKLETAEAKAQATQSLANVQPQQQLNPAATANAKTDPQTAENQLVDPAKLPAASLQLSAALEMSVIIPPVLESANPPTQPALEGAQANVKQEQVPAQSQANEQLSQANGQINTQALQARNAEANPQSVARQQVQSAQLARVASAQPTNPINAPNSTGIVQTASAKDNLPRMQVSQADPQQEHGTAKAQASRALSLANAQTKAKAAQAQEAESNPQSTVQKQVQATEVIKIETAQPTKPLDVNKQAEAVRTARTQDNLPQMKATQANLQQEQGTVQAQASRLLTQAKTQTKSKAAQARKSEANPQAAIQQTVRIAQTLKSDSALATNPVESKNQTEAVETAQAESSLPTLKAAPVIVTQEQVTAQAQTNQQYSQPNAKANPEALQARNAEANPQSTARQQVQSAQADKAAIAQATNPVNAKNPTEIVQAVPAKDNLPRLHASQADTRQEQGAAKAQVSEPLVKAAKGQTVKVSAKANQPQSQPDLDAALANAVKAAEQVANAAVTNAAPARLSATAGLLNTATISPAAAPAIAAATTSLEQAKPEALGAQDLMAANKTNPLLAAKANSPKSEALANAKAIRLANNFEAKNVAAVERAGPVSAQVGTVQVLAAKVNVVVPDLKAVDSPAGGLESIEPTIFAGKQLGGAKAKQEVSKSNASVVKSNVLKHNTPLVAAIGLNKMLTPNLQTALTLGAATSRGSLSVATGSSPGPSVEELAHEQFGLQESHPAAVKVAGKILQAAKGSVNIQATAIPSSAPAGGPMETEQVVQPKTLPKVGSMQMAALPTPELNAEPLALPGAGNGVVLPDMEFKPGVVFEAPRRTANPMILRKNPKVRLNYIERLGGSQETEKAVRRALDWFTRNQEKDGHWRGQAGHTSAATGMAMLAYMGWGAKHSEPGPYQKPLAKAADWLLRHERNGDLRGRGDMYDHGIAAIALAEAYSLTKDSRLRRPVERVIAFTIKAQNPKSGGWRYRSYKENPREKGDMSVTGWQLMALRSAQLGGFEVPDRVFNRTKSFLEYVAEGKHGGDYRYLPRRARNVAMISEGMFCQQLLYLPPASRQMRESTQYIQRDLPSQRNVNYYYWYYGSLAMHQNQGEPWENWNEKLRPILVRNQVRNADREDGSWDPTGKWGPEAGRCVITAMATLSLEVYYRYLPLSSPAWLNKGK